jgi:anti-sigma regulatory factor (Ser/Thr protein kinase)
VLVDTTTIASGAGDHIVQFYEHDAELAEIVARWLRGASSEEVSIVVATQAHREQFAAALAAEVTPSSRGRVVWLDAAATLARLIRNDEIDAAAFDSVVGGVVREAAQDGRAVRVYGEMVALLWKAGNVLGAIELEGHWNALADEAPFALLCSYPAAIIGDSEHAGALTQVCEAHSACHHSCPDDGTAVIDASASEGVRAAFSPQPSAPASARRLTTHALRQWGYSTAAIDDAGLVVSELVTNAVVHARSQLTLTVHRDEQKLLRIAVQDTTPVAAQPPSNSFLERRARGLGIVATLSADWGVQALRDGKIVWAQLKA